MPVRLKENRHRELHSIFQMNLLEGYVLEQLRNRLAKMATVAPMYCWRALTWPSGGHCAEEGLGAPVDAHAAFH